MYDFYGAILDDAATYENLLWYNGNSSTQLIPWLASNYTVSPDLKTYNFTLRSGITFADGEPLNSSAVYFSLNRVLVMDASTPSGHGTQFAPDFQNLLNTSLASALCGCEITYNQAFVNEVLAENFVQITGPMTFSIHLETASNFFPYILSNYNFGWIIAPEYVMQHDLALWNQSSTGYTLPYPKLTGNMTNQIYEYYLDEVATCNSGLTPNGCGTTYLDGSYQGSLAGTGPYTITSYGQSTNDLTFQVNPNYWGGPYQFMGGKKISPAFTTVKMDYVPNINTRELDLQNAAKSGQAMAIDIPNNNIYDVADRNSWLNNGTLVSTVPGVSLYGPLPVVGTNFVPFAENVTDALTGTYYNFQPFADLRMRLAFADSINMSAINEFSNNNLGQAALNVIPPPVAPNGIYNSSVAPIYSYNLTATQDLLLQAMEHPLTQFTFVNGTVAPGYVFNDTFGCPTLGANGMCANPVQRSVSLTYDAGDTFYEAIFTDMADAINNISDTYNMGLTVQIEPIPDGQMLTQGLSDQLYSSYQTWVVDYPWASNILGAVLAPGHFTATSDGWNLTRMSQLYQQDLAADAQNNVSGLIKVSNAMNELANQAVEYVWVNHPETVAVITSNVKGFSYNPALGCLPSTCVGFANLYVG
jgi:ABC-type transport system substrate-binding protein